MKIFISASWKKQQQRNRIGNLISILDGLGIDHYSGGQDNIWDFTTNPQQAHDYHMDALKDSDMVIAFADEFIERTTFEVGFAYALNIPIILASAAPLSTINLFIMKSALCVVQSGAELTEVLDGTNQFHVYNWTGTTETNK